MYYRSVVHLFWTINNLTISIKKYYSGIFYYNNHSQFLKCRCQFIQQHDPNNIMNIMKINLKEPLASYSQQVKTRHK